MITKVYMYYINNFIFITYNGLQISEVNKLKTKNMWTLRILKEPIKYQTIGGFLFRLFGVSRRSEQLVCDACKRDKQTKTLEDCKCGKGKMWVKAN